MPRNTAASGAEKGGTKPAWRGLRQSPEVTATVSHGHRAFHEPWLAMNSLRAAGEQALTVIKLICPYFR